MRLLAGIAGSADGVAEQWERSGEHRTPPETGLIEEKQLSGPEFGPGGYLPPKASKRARKIVLREQMGFGWPLAAIAAAVLVAVAGGTFLWFASQPPGEPYVPVGSVTDVPPDGAAMLSPPAASTHGEVLPVLVVRAGGGIRGFRVDGREARWCEASRRIEGPDRAWLPDGRQVFGDDDPLRGVRIQVFDGVVYVDPDTPVAPAGRGPAGAPPACY